MHMRVPERRTDGFMAEQLLDHLQIAPEPPQLRRRRMPQIVKAGSGNTCRLRGLGEIGPNPAISAERPPALVKHVGTIQVTLDAPEDLRQGITHRQQ
jgi:hypothetical protein